MAENTSTILRNKLVYSVFPRNYTSSGSFKSVRDDLVRIRKLGTDII